MQGKKAALEISFGWLFAIIAGVIIIFGAIYLSTKIIRTEQETISVETGKEIGILLNPLETSFESAQTTSITIPAETRINNGCELVGNFGEQLIRLDQKSFDKWIETNINIRFSNKYIFSNAQIEGKKFFIFSKPFEFPFKIADLMYITSSKDTYCFISAPDEIEDEISDLSQQNLLTENCSESDIKVCFESNDCDINVNYDMKYVEKDNDEMYFEGDSLMYAAIFADSETYECQLKRLMLRLKEISRLYQEKEIFMGEELCGSNLGWDLNELSELAGSLENSEQLEIIAMTADTVSEKNDARRCMLW
ncbi:hypothetical protein A3K82_03725 [Candidatus Pacearchaeota archaeon RBG_19FT_COMBO_34_9]|nr:MAG: hypothetical protein A3K82_03725 [Candidatus Pacearchaeota archaeon RBG_19FT_COMBO_34_9]OGJ16135.1 MAG: hypothetical protein A3K74_02800 [Candidatus Pacearchaeota archaeon RBG_13_33_26]